MKTALIASLLLVVLQQCCCSNPLENRLNCYQCDSSRDIRCNQEPVSRDLLPTPCIGEFSEPKYCVKMTAASEGKVIITRLCSEKFLGNNCTYGPRPGDLQQYHSCVYTCERDGCNGSSALISFDKWFQFAAATLISLPFIAHQRI